MGSLGDETLINAVAKVTMSSARPLYWHDVKVPFPKKLCGGSCFILRFGRRLVGVTANHVIEAFEKSRSASGSVCSFLRTIPFQIHIIDRDKERDIATFEVTEEQLVESKGMAIDCRDEWPPPIPDVGREISFAGFPELLREPWRTDGGECRAFVNLTHVVDVTEHWVIATYEPNRDRRLVASRQIEKPVGVNWSGCSGGPVLMHVERNGLHRWFPVGIMLQGPEGRKGPEQSGCGVATQAIKNTGKAIPGGALLEFDTFRLGRLLCLKPDGSLKRASAGWLPG